MGSEIEASLDSDSSISPFPLPIATLVDSIIMVLGTIIFSPPLTVKGVDRGVDAATLSRIQFDVINVDPPDHSPGSTLDPDGPPLSAVYY